MGTFRKEEEGWKKTVFQDELKGEWDMQELCVKYMA